VLQRTAATADTDENNLLDGRNYEVSVKLSASLSLCHRYYDDNNNNRKTPGTVPGNRQVFYL